MLGHTARMVVKPKVAVIGTGSLGKEHARIYSELAQRGEVDFVGIHDHSTEAARKVADKLHVPIFRSLEEAAAAAEAFSVVTPTVTHFDIASALLRQGKHVLVEKPMTDNSDQAAVLVDLARTKNLILHLNLNLNLNLHLYLYLSNLRLYGSGGI